MKLTKIFSLCLMLLLLTFLFLSCDKVPVTPSDRESTEEENGNEEPNPNQDPNENENNNQNQNEEPNGNEEPNPNQDPNGQEDDKPYIRFKVHEAKVFQDFDYELEFETNYEGELEWTIGNEDYLWLDDTTVTGLELGETTVTVSFVLDGETYSDVMNIKVVEMEYKITINDVIYEVAKGTSYEDFLKDAFGEKGYPEKEGYEFIGWYYDSNFKKECHDYSKVNSNVSLYPKYKKYLYGMKIDKVFGYHSSSAVSGNVILIAPSYDGSFRGLDLSNYNLIAVRYDPSLEDYFVVKTNEKVLYYDGFLLGIKKNTSEETEFLEKLSVGTKIWLDSYSCIKASKILLEHEIDPSVTPVSMAAIDSTFVSAYDVTNKVDLGNKNGDMRAYPASTTKIITAMAALKYCPIDTTYTIGAELDLMNQGSSPSTAGLVKGQTWTLSELLYATLLPSGNDAAYSVGALTIQYLYPNNTWTIRERLDKFAELMNEVAREAGATKSHFMVPDGNSYYVGGSTWDDRLTYHYVTANDMVKIVRYALTFGELAEVVSTVSKSLTISGKTYSWTNTNHLLNPTHSYYYAGTVGVKTGTTTPAGQCLITAVFKEDRLVIVAIMKAGSSGRDAASHAVYNLIFR